MSEDVIIDLSQFHGIFYDECSEGLEIMEAQLLVLDIGEPDVDVINTIFRAAHSIKGSAGTFGFTEISSFTHELETVLNEMRDGRLQLSQETKTVLLSSVDCLTELIHCSKNNKSVDDAAFIEMQKTLADLSSNASDEVAQEVPEEEEVAEDEAPGVAWHILFNPHENLFFTGNDPFRLLRELKTLGRLEVNVDLSKLPNLQEIDPENCYLGWDMVLYGNVTLNEINEIFAWVEEDCDLEINLEQDVRAASDRRAADTEQGGRRKADQAIASKRDTSSIRVSTEKVDELLNLVGEMVITQSMLSRISMDSNIEQSGKFIDCLKELERNTRDLQKQTMSIRMLPIDFAFQRLPRMVHDLSHSLGKKVNLVITGESTELDKTVLEKIGDPLLHLVRNSLDHGLESSEERIKAGKPETGTINVNAHHLGGSIIIEISDDGAGIDTDRVLDIAINKGIVDSGEKMSDIELQNLIFTPGFQHQLM